MTDLPQDSDVPEVDEIAGTDVDGDAGAGDGADDLLDRLRGTGVGVEDPNIVGDAGPTDVAPGRDPGGGGLLVTEEPGDDVPPVP